MEHQYQIETRCIHGETGFIANHPFGAIPAPIYQTASFAHPGIGQSTGYDYSRQSNPTRTELEQTVASLENAADAVATSSGMAAIGLCIELLPNGSHVICSEDLYGGSVRLFESVGAARGCRFSYVDTSDAETVEQAIGPDTRALYIETPSNPTMKVTDLARMKELAEQHGLLYIVDNTFLSPYFQNPLDFGADLVVHSGTKYLGGHNDTLAGFVCMKDAALSERIRSLYKTTGPCLSPFDSFLILRGLKTLPLRMEAQQKNAMQLAVWLREQKRVKRVRYAGLPDHEGYEVSCRQTRGFGSMISLQLESEAAARRVLERVRVISYAESLGGVESLITYPMLQTHADLPEETRRHLGITEDFLRISVGVENAADLIADLEQALA